MRDAFRVVRAAIVDLWDHAFLVIFCSLVWLFLVLLIIPGPPATIAIFSISRSIVANEYLLEFRDYLRRFGAILAWAGAGRQSIFRCCSFWLSTSELSRRCFRQRSLCRFRLAFYLVLGFWIVVNWYALAFLFQQERTGVLQALRNGGVSVAQASGILACADHRNRGAFGPQLRLRDREHACSAPC